MRVGSRSSDVDGALAHELAGHDHGGGRARRAVVGEAPERALARREELRQVEVLDVVERHDASAPATRGDGTVSG